MCSCLGLVQRIVSKVKSWRTILFIWWELTQRNLTHGESLQIHETKSEFQRCKTWKGGLSRLFKRLGQSWEWGRQVNNAHQCSHYKKYTIEEQKIALKKPDREKPIPKTLHGGLEDAKNIYLANLREESKLVYIATNLEPKKEIKLIKILQKFWDVFVWSFKNLKGVDPLV